MRLSLRLIHCNTLSFQEEPILRTGQKSPLQHSLFWQLIRNRTQTAELVMHMRWVLWKSCGTSSGSLPVGSRSHECDNKRTKNWFCYLNLPVTHCLPAKRVSCVINRWQFCAAKLAKSANYANSAFFRKKYENYARDGKLCQTLC